MPCRACHDCLTGRYQSCRQPPLGHGVTGVDVPNPASAAGSPSTSTCRPSAVLHKIDASSPRSSRSCSTRSVRACAGRRTSAGIGLGDTVLVLGAGQRGIASVIAARAAGAGTVIVDRPGGRRAQARAGPGVRRRPHAGRRRARRRGHRRAGPGDHRRRDGRRRPGADPDGRTPPSTDALLAARHGGTVVLAGLKGDAEVPLRTDLIINRALTVRGAFGVDATAYAEAIAIIESRRYPAGEAAHPHVRPGRHRRWPSRPLAGEVPGESAVHVSVHPHN